MANNLRTLKKDVEFVINELISDCCTFVYMHPDKNEDEAVAIINKALDLRDMTINKINNPQDNPIKPYFKQLKQEFINEVDALFTQVSELAK